MIPKEYIDAYKSIKAPQTLHDRVTASSASPVRRTRILPRLIAAGASLAASFAVITVAVIAFNMSRSDIGAFVAYNGQPVEAPVALTMNEASAISFYGMGRSENGGIRLEVHTDGEAVLSVSNGAVTLVDENGGSACTGSLLTLPNEGKIHIVYWQADFYEINEGTPFSLVIENAHGSVTYTLTDSNGELMLAKDSKN